MSPELFKCYINDLSEQLNNMDDVDVPVLNNVRISHLLLGRRSCPIRS